MKSGIYQIMNKKNYEIYIGSAIDMGKRWKKHKREFKNKNHHNIILQKVWNKYGENIFEFSEVEFVEKKDLIQKEQFYMDLWKPEYNIAKNAEAPMLNRNHSKKTKQKQSIAKVGKNNPMFGKTGKSNPMYGKGYLLVGEKNGMFNKHHTKKTKQNQSILMKKYWKTKERGK